MSSSPRRFLDWASLRGADIREAFERPIDEGHSRDRLTSFLRSEGAAYSAITVGDLFYDAWRIDPAAVEAIDFASMADLSDIAALSDYSGELLGQPGAALEGSVERLKGYVAERFAANIVRKTTGAEVSFPESATEEGFDLLINGDPFQVKCVGSSSSVDEHLEKYPGIPVLVNEEMGATFQDNPNVITLDGLSNEAVREVTVSTLDGAEELVDYEILAAASTVVIARYGVAWVKGSTGVKDMVLGGGTDLAVRGAAGSLGGIATAATIPLIGITGGWAAIVMPLFGGIGAAAYSRKMSDYIKAKTFCRTETNALEKALIAYCREAAEVIRNSMGVADRKADRVEAALSGFGAFAEALRHAWRRRFEQEKTFREVQLARLEKIAGAPHRHRSEVGGLLGAALDAIDAAALGGVLPRNIPIVTERLEATIQSCVICRRRFLLA